MAVRKWEGYAPRTSCACTSGRNRQVPREAENSCPEVKREKPAAGKVQGWALRPVPAATWMQALAVPYLAQFRLLTLDWQEAAEEDVSKV